MNLLERQEQLETLEQSFAEAITAAFGLGLFGARRDATVRRRGA